MFKVDAFWWQAYQIKSLRKITEIRWRLTQKLYPICFWLLEFSYSLLFKKYILREVVGEAEAEVVAIVVEAGEAVPHLVPTGLQVVALRRVSLQNHRVIGRKQRPSELVHMLVTRYLARYVSNPYDISEKHCKLFGNVHKLAMIIKILAWICLPTTLLWRSLLYL